MTLTVAAVQTGNYAGRGAEYVSKLFDGIRRHMPQNIDFRCVCITDDVQILPPGVQAKDATFGPPSWWQKLLLFRPGMFETGSRVLYFDLDTIVLGDLTGFADYRGQFAALRDPFAEGGMNSALMAWEAGALDHLWTRWDAAGRPQFDPRGDQNWISQMCGVQPDYWHKLLPGQAVSFKKDCWRAARIPQGARVIFFHGHPRPHECQAPFIKELWSRPSTNNETGAQAPLTVGIQAQRASARNSTPLESA